MIINNRQVYKLLNDICMLEACPTDQHALAVMDYLEMYAASSRLCPAVTPDMSALSATHHLTCLESHNMQLWSQN